jgi:hypothetical protein
MTSGTMLSSLRTLLDEVSAGFYTDAELYNALSFGQRECVYYFANLFKKARELNPSEPLHRYLKTLVESEVDTATTTEIFQFNSVPILILNALYKNSTLDIEYKPCFIRDEGGVYDLDNEYLKPSPKSPTVEMYNTGNWYYRFRPEFDNTEGGDYVINWIKEPTDITSVVQPIVSEDLHNAIVQYAFSFILRKDSKMQESGMELQKFYQILSTL